MNGFRFEEVERYNQMLDDCYEDAEICGMTYSPSRAFFLVDPIAYRCGLGDWLSHLESDGEYCSEKELFSDEDGFDDEEE